MRRSHRESGSVPLQDLSQYEEEIIDESEYYEEEIIEEIIEEQAPAPLPERKTTIKFNEYDEMMTVLHINDYTNNEISKTWFCRKDYTKMNELARNTVQKSEERRKEIKAAKAAGKDATKHKVIEARGLEAWSTEGAAAIRRIKEAAVEAVFYEQCRQWDTNTHDVEKLREVYRAVSMKAQQVAEDRAKTDQKLVQEYLSKEREGLDDSEKKKKKSGGLGKKTKKLAKVTSKVAKKTGKVAQKTAVATATLDKKMFKEAVKSIPKKKKRECEHQVVHTPSQSAQAMKTPEERASLDHGQLVPVLVDEDADENGNSTKKKKSKKKLKLLGVVPVPGTQKKYKEDRFQKKIEKRQKKQSNRAAWEDNAVANGKY